MSSRILDALAAIDAERDECERALRDRVSKLETDNTSLREQSRKLVALLSRRTLGIAYLITYLRDECRLDKEQIDRLTYGMLDLDSEPESASSTP